MRAQSAAAGDFLPVVPFALAVGGGDIGRPRIADLVTGRQPCAVVLDGHIKPVRPEAVSADDTRLAAVLRRSRDEPIGRSAL